MKRIFFYNLSCIVLLLAILISCKKKPKAPAGTWIAIGDVSVNGGSSPPPPDAFLTINITPVNDNVIVVNNDTLHYKSSPSSGIFEFGWNNSYASRPSYITLTYNSKNNSCSFEESYSTSSGNADLSVSTSAYKPNPLLSGYLPKIVGTKMLSGIGHDYFIIRTPPDSMFTMNVNIAFTAINGSTLTFDNDVLKLGDNILHYKATDYAQKKVIFQNFHTFSYSLSTLTYYYEADSITFEQEYKTAPPHNRSVILQ